MRKYLQPKLRKLNKRQARELAIDIANGMTKPQAAVKYGIHVRTVYRILQRDDEEIEEVIKRPKQKVKRLKKPPRPPMKLKPHGTNAAYMRHIRKGEPACSYCLAAHAQELELWRNGQNPAKLRKLYRQINADGVEGQSA